jgi:hypothetical protein
MDMPPQSTSQQQGAAPALGGELPAAELYRLAGVRRVPCQAWRV